MHQTTVDTQAADPKSGMTLDEMERFVRDARAARLPGSLPVKVTTGWASQIRVLQISGEPSGVDDIYTTRTPRIHDEMHYE